MTDTLAGAGVEHGDAEPSTASALQAFQFLDKSLLQHRSRRGVVYAPHNDKAGQTRTRRAQQLSSADHFEASSCSAAPMLPQAAAVEYSVE
jgi:hypothetical protein